MARKILVVDDNELILNLVSYILDDKGYQVEVLNCANGLFDCICSYHPDLIIMDEHLPDGSGCELCKEIKQSSETKKIPVVICSGDDVSTRYNNYYADGVLSKPFDIDELVNMVETKLSLAA